MDKHVANAEAVATWLERDPRIESVTYAGLEILALARADGADLPEGGGRRLFTFAVKGGYEACVKLVDNLKLFSHVANLGDTRSLVIHAGLDHAPAADR